MPSLGGGGRYGGDDPTGGASRGSGGEGRSYRDVNRETLAAHNYNLADPGLYGDLRAAQTQRAQAAARQRAMQDYQGRMLAEQGIRRDIDTSPLGWADRVAALNAAKAGQLGTLDKLGFDTSGMRSTHHSGGILGEMFGTTGDDVQTIGEARKDLADKGMISFDPQTGQPVLESGPMGYGFALSAFSPAVGEMAAKGVYEMTEAPQAAMGAGQLAAMGTAAAGRAQQPSSFSGMLGKAIGTGLNFAGVPAVTQIGQLAGALNTAADMQYAGIMSPGGSLDQQRDIDGTVVRQPTQLAGRQINTKPVYGSLFNRNRLG